MRIARTTLGYTVCKVTYALKKSHEGCESGVDPCPLDNFGSGFTERERDNLIRGDERRAERERKE